MNYKLAYRIGFHPWEEALHQQPFVASLSKLLDAEERGREKPYGRALDLGTGSGIWAVELAKRGWNVTGVDLVDKALERADHRAREAGVSVRFLKADVTNSRCRGSAPTFACSSTPAPSTGSAQRRGRRWGVRWMRSRRRTQPCSCSPGRTGVAAPCRGASIATKSRPPFPAGR